MNSTMEFLLSLIVLAAFCTDIAASYISSAPWKNGASFAQPPANIELDDIFREEYHAWAKRYGKPTSDSRRFENFKLNFMLQMQHNKKTGAFNHLNEFGDMTVKEFETVKDKDKSDDNVTNNIRNGLNTPNRKDPSDNLVEVELIVDSEPIPRVRTINSDSIPRVTPIGSPTRTTFVDSRDRQRSNTKAQKVSFSPYGRKYGSQDRQQPRTEPRVYRQDENQPPPPRRRRRLVRVGPDKIL